MTVKRVRLLGISAWLGLVCGSLAADPATYLEEVRDPRLDTSRAVAVSNLNLYAGMARFEIEEGVMFPATPVAGRSVEMVFEGRGRLVLEPPDDVEAAQLELFTGSRRMEETVTEAVIAIALDAAADNLAGRPRSVAPAKTAERAHEIFDLWKRRPERRLLGVETALLRDALGDPVYEGFFAGWFRGETLGELLYLFEPDAPEQVTLGQFTVLEASEKEKRKLARALHREQRKGRLIGLALEDLGVWDTWLSAARRDPEGGQRVGGRDFEPLRYTLDLTLTGSKLELAGRARIELECQSGIGRTVKLEIHSDLRVDRVSLGGEELFHHQVGDEILVALPRSPARGEIVPLDVEYSGRAVDRIDGKSYALRNTTHWHPHAGTVDLAAYDVTFHWPEKLDLVAGGELVASGKEPGRMRFERRRLTQPTFGYSFEIGRFKTLRQRAGHVDVVLAFDTLAYSALEQSSRQELLATICDALLYFEGVFGPYPLDRLTVVTAGRDFSQSFLGFVTLSNLSMLDVDWLTLALGLEDRRTVVAHEIAHQWWGHVVGWRSYRDQWISEAMANYAAVLYSRHRLRGGQPLLIGPTSGWQDALTELTADGRPIESLGPLVLGERLSSSRSSEAYQAVVYKKGAVVLDMLSRVFGEDAFLEILRHVVAAVSFQPISTEDFVQLLERLAGVELGPFVQQFIYGTGLPEVYYDYEFEPAEEGKWRVRGVARQESPYRYRYRVVPMGDGAFDVARDRLDQIEVSDSVLVVPFQIAVFNPEGRQDHDPRKEIDPRQAGNGILKGNLLLTGESTELDFKIDYEPKELWLDRQRQVFGMFFNERRFPKRVLYYRGLDLAAAGRGNEAEEAFHKALSAASMVGPSYGDFGDVELLETSTRHLDASIHLQLTRLYLDQRRPAEARDALARLRKVAGGKLRALLASELKTHEARLAIHDGDLDRAFRLLHKLEGDSTESLLLRAIAARLTGHADEYQAAVEAARDRGADVAALVASAPER